MKYPGIFVPLLAAAALLHTTFAQDRVMSSSAGWVVQTSPTQKPLYGVRACNPNVAWASGSEGGTMIRTTNGGTLWSFVPNTTFPGMALRDLEAVNDQRAFVAVYADSVTRILRTTNAGVKWDTVFTQPYGYIASIHMIDQNNGMAIGVGVPQPTLEMTVLSTTDGGATWFPLLNLPTGSGMGIYPYALEMSGSNNIWFAGSQWVFRSTDGGRSWTSTRPFPGKTFGRFAFPDPLHGVLVRWDGYSAWTADGGDNWHLVNLPDTGEGGEVVGVGTDFFATRMDKIYRSTDRGLTWATSYGGGIGILNSITLTSQGSNIICWAVSVDGNIVRYDGTMTGVTIPTNEIPRTYSLEQNYPNPFNPSTAIRYGLPNRSYVNLAVFSTLGQQLALLQSGEQEAGFHEVKFDASGLSSGVYFYRIQMRPLESTVGPESESGAREFVQTRKLVLVR